MPLSFLDFLSSKITLYYNGHDTHRSHVGGLLSLIYLILLALLLFNFFIEIFYPKSNSLLIYEENIKESKYKQNLDYSGLNHFFQIYSHSDDGWFGDFDSKNIIIYGIKETDKNVYIDDNESKIDLYNTEHWLYDKCENLSQINKYLFSEISQIIKNYTKSICLRYYYNPKEQQYYEIGLQGYISPYLETNTLSEKRYIYKIIIEKCFNNSIFTNKMHYICNSEKDIMKYLNIYNDIFIYFSDNQIVPKNNNYPFQKYFNSISSAIQKMSYFENNLIFAPLKLMTDRTLFKSNDEDLTFILKGHYHNDKLIGEELTTIGIFNFYFRNNIIIYKRVYMNILECFSHLGGTAQLLFFIFQMINFINNRYIIQENTKTFFKINTGIDINYIEGNDIFFDKMRHINSQNFRIKVFSNNNVNNNEDYTPKYIKNAQNRKKLKYSNYEYHGINQYINRPSKKNISLLTPMNMNSHRKKNIYETKRSQTKYTNTFKQMGKQLTIKNKRKSYMSQGFLMKRNEKKDYSAFSKNQSILENDIISNNNINDNNNSSFLLLKDIKDKEAKEGFFKYDSKNVNDINIIRKNIKKRTNLKKHQFENNESVIPQVLKKIDPNIKGRHKSVNFGNQRDFLFSANLLGMKNTFLGKNSSEYVNDSSKQVITPNKSPFLYSTSKFQVEKSKLDETFSRPSVINNDNNFNTIIYNNPNTETASYLKNIIQGKIKLIMNEGKQDYNLNNFLERKTKYSEFFKFIFICFKKNDNKLHFLHKFRIKLLSEEHIYKVHINLYLLEKIFQIDEAYKFNANEIYNNL